MNRYSLKNEPEYDTPWIAAPNNGGNVSPHSSIQPLIEPHLRFIPFL